MIENNSEGQSAVLCATQNLRHFFQLLLQSVIQPTDYDATIPEYMVLQNKTVKCFIDTLLHGVRESRGDANDFNKIERAWNWNERIHEPMFFGGAARPLFSETVTNFSDLLTNFFNKNDPLYVKNRSKLFNALHRLVREEGKKYWKNYELYPSTASKDVLNQCYQYFYFRDRDNTYFINSSGCDYIPFVHLAQKIFHENFIGSSMTDPDDFNTEWILARLVQECRNVCNRMRSSNPLILILLTSKNRFGARIDVDRIHQQLHQHFPNKIVTLIDACQDGQSFHNVDIIIYSKRFTTTGAIGLVHKRLSKEHNELQKNLTLGTSFPVSILAQLYCTINMMNTHLAFGIEDLVNSANWHNYISPVLSELQSALGPYHQQENSSSSIKILGKNGVQFEFTEDETGTIATIRLLGRSKEDDTLSRLMSELKNQGHTLDSFLLNDPLMNSPNKIDIKQVTELINNKDLAQLRAIEARCSVHLAWPLVPFSAAKSTDNLITLEHFDRCRLYHCCLRISIDRSGYPGKLKRLVDIVQQTLDSNEVTDAIKDSKNFQPYSSEWPARD
ncbi:unnamed protein product [Adineta ricciae]|uniref:Uncharacterized protein n=1 Tax=Adineta ricciae TaxID=249248 RepID=A0A815LSB9_ADIRI|nr:unnamed protein product [Adineta ricciae]CAF1413278.1 unnamed protein product [Adineta ricciae]